MQIIYGNDGANYRTFAQSDDITNPLFIAIHNEFNRYSFVQQSGLYSQEHEIRNVICVSSNLRGKLPGEHVFVVNNGRMPQFHTPSKFFQAFGWKADEDFYKEDFFSVFQMRWIPADQMLEYLDKKVDEMPEAGDASWESGELLSQETLKEILMLIYKNSLSVSKKTFLMADCGGDVYNQRAMQILYQIYRYLPYDMRRSSGFSTYMSDGIRESEIPQGVRIVITDPMLRQQNRSSFYIIGGDNQRLMSSMGQGWVSEYVDFLLGLSEEERTAFFDLLKELYPDRRLTGKDCSFAYELQEKIFEGEVQENAIQWIHRYYEAENEAIRNYIGKRIQQKISGDAYAELVQKELEKEGPNWWNWSEEFVQIINAADISEQFSLDEAQMKTSHETYVLSLAQGVKNQTEKRLLIEKEIGKLEAAPYGNKMKAICSVLIQIMKIAEEQVKKLEEEEIEEERKAINQDPLYKDVTIESMAQFLQTWTQKMRYPQQNKDFMIQCWCSSVDCLLEGYQGFFMNDKEREYSTELLQTAKPYIGEEVSEQYSQKLQEMSYYLEQFAESTHVKLNSKEDITEFLEKEEDLETLLNKLKKGEETEFQLCIGEEELEIEYKDLQLLMRFLGNRLPVSADEQNDVIDLFEQYPELRSALLKAQLLSEDHFYAVCISTERNEMDMKDVLDYFLYEQDFDIQVQQIEDVAVNIEGSWFAELLPDYKRVNLSVKQFLKEEKLKQKQIKKEQKESDKDKPKGRWWIR